MQFSVFPFLLFLQSFAHSLSTVSLHSRKSFNSEIIAQLPGSAENIAAGPHGDLLVTLITSPYLYSVIPPKQPLGDTLTATLVANLTNEGKQSLLGITKGDGCFKFYFIGGNPSFTNITAGLGTYSIFSIDFATSPAAVQNVADVYNATLLNGLATLSAEKSLIIGSDSPAGQIFLINTATGDVSVLLADKTMDPVNGSPIGINGLRVLATECSTDWYVKISPRFGRLCKVCELNFIASTGGAATTILGGGNETIVDTATSCAIGVAGRLFCTTNSGTVVEVGL
jgi:hypothetical protein